MVLPQYSRGFNEEAHRCCHSARRLQEVSFQVQPAIFWQDQQGLRLGQHPEGHREHVGQEDEHDLQARQGIEGGTGQGERKRQCKSVGLWLRGSQHSVILYAPLSFILCSFSISRDADFATNTLRILLPLHSSRPQRTPLTVTTSTHSNSRKWRARKSCAGREECSSLSTPRSP